MSSSVTATCPRCKKPFRQVFDFAALADEIIDRLRVEADCPNPACEARVVVWVQGGGTTTTEILEAIPLPDDQPPRKKK